MNCIMHSMTCLLLNGTSALFMLLVPRIVEIEHMRYVKTICNRQEIKKTMLAIITIILVYAIEQLNLEQQYISS